MLLGKPPRGVVQLADPFHCSGVNHVNDQRVEARSSLRFVDARDRFGVGGVSRETVDRLGRDRDRLAGEDQPPRLGDAFVGEWKNPRLHEARLEQ